MTWAPSLSSTSTREEDATVADTSLACALPLYSSRLWCAAVAIFPLRPGGEK